MNPGPQGLRIGLTGGIGSGKSTVARMLVGCGAHLVDTDAIARALTLPAGAAMPALAEAFGQEALAADGSLNREHMRRLVFQDPAAKARLEGILHPLIGQETAHQAAAAQGQVVVFDVPLLAESQGPQGWRTRVDRVLVIDCSEDTQVRRVAERASWSAEAAQRVIAQQVSRRTRRAVADALIHNEGLDLVQLEDAVHAVWRRWQPLHPAHDRKTAPR